MYAHKLHKVKITPQPSFNSRLNTLSLGQSPPPKKIACTCLSINAHSNHIYVNTAIRRFYCLLFSTSALRKGAGCETLGPQRAALWAPHTRDGVGTRAQGSGPRLRSLGTDLDLCPEFGQLHLCHLTGQISEPLQFFCLLLPSSQDFHCQVRGNTLGPAM